MDALINFDKEEILAKAKENTKSLGDYKFTYDKQYDILRVWFSTNFHHDNAEAVSTITYVVKNDGKIVFIEIHGFMKQFIFNNDYLPKDINSYLIKVHDAIVEMNLN